MAAIIPIAENITTLTQVEDKFNLRQADSDEFFSEWFEGLPEITDQETETLDRGKKDTTTTGKEGL